MAERGPSLAEIIGAKLAGLFRGRALHRASRITCAQPVPSPLRPVPLAAPFAADDRLVAAYRDLLRMPG